MNMKMELFAIAKTDLEASKVLYDNGLYPQAIFYFQQSVEKANKSFALITNQATEKELPGNIGHKTIKIYENAIIKQKQKYESFNETLNRFPEIKSITFTTALLGPPQPTQTTAPATPQVIAQKETPTSASTTPSRYILIKHSNRYANSIGKFSEAQAGKTFLIITLDIENHGYQQFNTNPFNWAVDVDKIRYGYSVSSFSLDGKLDSVDVLDGGSIKGSLAFEVPEGTTSYTIYYTAPFTDYNIKWEYVR